MWLCAVGELRESLSLPIEHGRVCMRVLSRLLGAGGARGRARLAVSVGAASWTWIRGRGFACAVSEG